MTTDGPEGQSDEVGKADAGALPGEAVDEAMSPVADELWSPILPAARAELDDDARAAQRYRPTAEDIIARMRANGLDDPERS